MNLKEKQDLLIDFILWYDKDALPDEARKDSFKYLKDKSINMSQNELRAVGNNEQRKGSFLCVICDKYFDDLARFTIHVQGH